MLQMKSRRKKAMGNPRDIKSSAKERASQQRVLLLAPSGRDNQVARQALGEADLSVRAVESMASLCANLGELDDPGIGAIVLAEEALAAGGLVRLSSLLSKQPTWSDLPILLLAAPSSSLAESRLNEVLASLGNVTLLERPMRRLTLLVAVQVALRQRNRQLAMRELLLKQRRAVEQRDHFLAMLGHELRNPLSAIVLASKTISCEEPSSLHRYLDVVDRQAANLKRLVDDILDVSKAGQEKLQIERRPLDLRRVVAHTIDAKRAALESRGLHLVVHLASFAVPVLGDSVRLEQVLDNLVSNAARFTPIGGRIEILAQRTEERALLRVTDTGEGIPPEKLSQIFELFAQVDDRLERHRGGLGLGLPLVDHIVRLHGGTIEAKSEGKGKGASFQISLPITDEVVEEEGNGFAAGPHPTAPPTEELKARALRVLLVEDEDDNREMLLLILRRQGLEVTGAANGEEAIDRLREEPIDVGLIDIGLPDIDGYSVCEEARRVRGKDVLLLALTGYGHPEAKKRAKQAGFDAHLTKPVDLQRLNSLMEQWKSKRHQESRPEP